MKQKMMQQEMLKQNIKYDERKNNGTKHDETRNDETTHYNAIKVLVSIIFWMLFAFISQSNTLLFEMHMKH